MYMYIRKHELSIQRGGLLEVTNSFIVVMVETVVVVKQAF